MKKALLILGLALAMSACASQRCDKVRPYQKTVAGKPLLIPDGLSEPRVRSRAPEVQPNAPTHRADGRCLEDPPLVDTEVQKPEDKKN